MSRLLLLTLAFGAGIGVGILDNRWQKAKVEWERLLDERVQLELHLQKLHDLTALTEQNIETSIRLLRMFGVPKGQQPLPVHPTKLTRDKKRRMSMGMGGSPSIQPKR